ncbi:SCP2 domain-containing protein, partial [Salmonella enterica]|uniref:ubiquinone anaerobic biosynthesis accessory factor UbiT n=1 Tax=Salmonella enterica TaxID=28901 RepID=UPI00398C5B1D
IKWYNQFENERLVVGQQADAAVGFRADASDLLRIAGRQQDPDTLFFQRRLVIEGETELGLYVKNLMDALELEQMPKALRVMLLQLADFAEAVMKHSPDTQHISVVDTCPFH